MNDNEQSFSNTPYKATGNLNTVIGNPDININSAVTSNIMENNQNVSNLNSEMVSNESMTFNNSVNQSNTIQMPTVGSNSNSSIQNQTANENVSEPETDPVRSFIDKTTSQESQVNTSFGSDTSYVNTVNNMDSFNTNLNNYNPYNTTGTTDGNVQYENAYVTDKKKKPKKTVKIPSEFKTAIFVVLLLLILLSCFDTIYDFFRRF